MSRLNFSDIATNPPKLAYALFRDRKADRFSCYSYQEPILSDIFLKRNRFFQLQQCTQTGKTEILALVVAMCAVFRPRERINIISYTLKQSQEMFLRVKSHLLYDHEEIARRVRPEPLTQTEIHVIHDPKDPSKDSIISCYTASQQSKGENLLGFFGTINILDESGSVPDPVYHKKILRMGVARTSHAMLVESGTPHRRNYFYTSSLDPQYTHCRVSVDDGLRAGALDRTMVDFIRPRLHPRQWKAWYEADFPGDEESFFPTTILEPNIVSEEHVQPVSGAHYVMGLDFAREVDRSVFTTAELRHDTLWERKIMTYGNVDYTDQMRELSMHCDRFAPRTIFGDEGGPGAPLLEQVERHMKVKHVEKVSFSSMKTAIYVNLRNLLVEGRLLCLYDRGGAAFDSALPKSPGHLYHLEPIRKPFVQEVLVEKDRQGRILIPLKMLGYKMTSAASISTIDISRLVHIENPGLRGDGTGESALLSVFDGLTIYKHNLWGAGQTM